MPDSAPGGEWSLIASWYDEMLGARQRSRQPVDDNVPIFFAVRALR
ncbi:MAG: hypothetical protein ACLPUO_03635 [Streptosporangiaceae bacterium]